MFMIVSYPWPVPSAHVQLAGSYPVTFGDGIDDRARAEKLVRWTFREWLRFSWYRLHMTARDNIPACVAMGLYAWFPMTGFLADADVVYRNQKRPGRIDP